MARPSLEEQTAVAQEGIASESVSVLPKIQPKEVGLQASRASLEAIQHSLCQALES